MVRPKTPKTELLGDETDEAIEKRVDLDDTQEMAVMETISEVDEGAQRQVIEGLDAGAAVQARKKLEILNAENLENAKGLLDEGKKAVIEWAEGQADAVFERPKVGKSDIAALKKILEGKGSRLYGIEDKDIRVALGKLLSAQVREKIAAKKLKMKEDAVKQDWRNPDAFPVPKKEMPNSGKMREMTEEEAEEAVEQGSGNSAELPSSAMKGAEDAQERFSERLENMKEGIVDVGKTVAQESRGEDRQRRLAFINKQKSFWTRLRMRLGFISDQERIEEYEDYNNN